MIKKIFMLIVAILLVSCGSSKSTASRSSKHVYRKPNTSVTARKPVHKPAARKPVRVVRSTSAGKSAESHSSANQNNDNSASETLQATTRVKVTTEIVLNYINQFKEIAKSNMSQYGIPSSIILAQGILESGAGTGPLSAIANNHFGIKCHDWTGESVKYDDDSAQECFRKYNRAAESYADHATFLTGRSRYAALFKLDRDDYKGWAKGLRAAGYATDPNYPQKLIGLIERYQLSKYDAEVLGKNYVPAVSQIAAVETGETYQVNAGDTLYSISRKFNLSVDELRRINGMQDNALSIGQFLKVK